MHGVGEPTVGDNPDMGLIALTNSRVVFKSNQGGGASFPYHEIQRIDGTDDGRRIIVPMSTLRIWSRGTTHTFKTSESTTAGWLASATIRLQGLASS
jgi:hypothetical protein